MTALDRIARIAVLLLLLSVATYATLVRTLGDGERATRDRRYVSATVSKGPAVIDGIEWRLDSLRSYTRLADKDGEQLELDVPANATAVVAEISLTPTERADVNLVTCKPDLLDDRGNVWPVKDSDLYGYPMPTGCYDDDLNMAVGKTSKVAAIYVVPKEAVPHLLGHRRAGGRLGGLPRTAAGADHALTGAPCSARSVLFSVAAACRCSTATDTHWSNAAASSATRSGSKISDVMKLVSSLFITPQLEP